MSAIKKYLKQETRWSMLTLEYVKTTDFYLSVWQTNRSAVPLLICRSLLFICSLGIVLISKIFYIVNETYGFWFIYLTHWGLMLIIFTTGFSVLISTRCYIYGSISAEFALPWYVKIYWVLYNIAGSISFLITVFYWTLLFEAGIEEEPNYVLDVAVHGLNSVVMLVLILSSSVHTRLLHFYQPLIFGLAYVLFGVVYHFAGGLDQKGNAYIYPVVDWNSPGVTVGVVALTGLMLVLLHLFTICLTWARDAAASCCVSRTPDQVTRTEAVPLREHQIHNTKSL